MKAKKIIPKKNEQPNPLPAPSNEERKDQLAPWQKEIIALAEARLSLNGEHAVVFNMHRRTLGLCRIVEDMAMGQTESGTSLDALAKVMEIVQEDIQVAKWITSGRPLYSNWL
jgi:hypothetical protein